MRVKTGYKLTEIGVIPEDWGVMCLGECASFRTGPFGSALHKSDYINDGVPVVNPMHILAGKIAFERTMTITEQAATNLADFRLKVGEIVIGRRGDMGRCAIVQAHQVGWLCGTGSMIIRCTNRADAVFLQRVLSSPQAISAIENASVGTTMINLNQGTLAGLRIQIPPLPEQRAIAGVLGDVDGLISALDQLVAKKENIKTAAMQQLLTGKTRLPGFNGQWETKQLGEIVKIQKGQLITSNTLSNGDVPVIAGGKHPAYFHSVANRIGKTITVSASGANAGYVALYKEPIFASDCSTISESKTYCLDFMFYQLLCKQQAIYKVQTGGAQPHIHAKDLNPILFALPSLLEQTAIAAVLSDMDAEIAALKLKKSKTCALKTALMQELLTGKTRLIATTRN